VIESAKGDTLTHRPKLQAALKAARKIKDDDYKAAPIIVAKLDRLSRDVHFISGPVRSCSSRSGGALMLVPAFEGGGVPDESRGALFPSWHYQSAIANMESGERRMDVVEFIDSRSAMRCSKPTRSSSMWADAHWCRRSPGSIKSLT
jgi:hypothetical protein